MDSINSTNNLPVNFGDAKRAGQIAQGAGGSDDAKKIKTAKEFEGILVAQLMNKMKETVGESGFLEDGSSKQVQDMFWDFLGQEVGKNGGFGMWKKIYKTMLPSSEPGIELKTGNDTGIDQKA